MESKQQIKQARIRAIVMGSVLVFALLCFMYGLINNIRMKQERQLALDAKAFVIACETESSKLTKQLQEKEKQLIIALQEARMAKDFALEQAKIAKKVSEKDPSKK